MWGYPGHMGAMGWGYGNGWGLMGMVPMLLFWALIVIGVIAAIRYLSHGNAGGSRGETDRALELLRERYARGEIDHEEFEQRRKRLSP